MRLAFWVRRTHKWIGLLVGVQALLWMISGLYMVAVPLDVIHGDHLAHVNRAPLSPSAARIDQGQLLARYPGTSSVRFKRLLDMEVLEIRQGKELILLDAASGRQLSPLDSASIKRLAAQAYQGSAQVLAVEWINTAPQEVGTRPAPMWAVHYTGPGRTTLYFSPYTGELLAKRHSLWRWFDFLWMFHIMDYETRDDVNNNLLRAASTLGLAIALSGAWLLLYSFGRRRRA
jgi:uncharacterized iron-regulated membrane protein